MASTAYKRARSLGWDDGYSSLISFLIIIHMSVGAWPDSLFESGSNIFIITIPLYILQLYMLFKNAIPIKSSLTGRRIGNIHMVLQIIKLKKNGGKMNPLMIQKIMQLRN